MAGTTKEVSVESLKPKKANLLDHYAIKHLLDETTSEISLGFLSTICDILTPVMKFVVFSRGYTENHSLSNLKMALGLIIICIALAAQFYPKKFPENKNFLIVCIVLYVLFNIVLQIIIYTKEKNNILFTLPLNGSFTSTGLAVSSKLPRCSDMYTLCISSADPKSIIANPPVELTKSVTKWFTKDGVLVETLFWKDVEKLIADYENDSRKSK